MPLREYACGSCNHRWEIIQGHDEDDPTICPNCKAEDKVSRQLSAPRIIFKGTGWNKPAAQPEFNVMVNPNATSQEERFKVVERTPGSTKECQEIHADTASKIGNLSAEKSNITKE